MVLHERSEPEALAEGFAFLAFRLSMIIVVDAYQQHQHRLGAKNKRSGSGDPTAREGRLCIDRVASQHG
jgi:hypothetical protein